MNKIANASSIDRQILFQAPTRKMLFHPAVIEKDFWVCYTLDYLFHQSPWGDSLAFKGGTSLSKAFNLIERFSEDIDLILDWRVLGYEIDEPWETRSKTKQEAFNKEANERTAKFLADKFAPEIKQGLSKQLNREANIYIDSDDKQTVIFDYPKSFKSPGILPVIRLEIGALAAWTPTITAEITPYVSKNTSKIFNNMTTSVRTVAPERTFWEKATILHQEANRPKTSGIPQRYFRHYYDLYRMAETPVKNTALSKIDLLRKVVDFKMKFYPRTWANYPNAKPGTLKLVPPEYRFPELKPDYTSMKDMFYGKMPDFDTVMDAVYKLEKEINTDGQQEKQRAANSTKHDQKPRLHELDVSRKAITPYTPAESPVNPPVKQDTRRVDNMILPSTPSIQNSYNGPSF